MSIVKKLNPSYKSQNQKTKAAPYLFFVLLFLIFYFPAIAGVAADPTPLKEITVVSDDNYPPFIFRGEKGHLQGILVDEWRLWEEKTGIKVDLRGMDWDKAKKTMAEGNAHVIDTIFFTEERAKTLSFSAPYASLDVPIFFHRDISGMKDVKSLHGFTIGVKAGDACIGFLKRHGIHTLREYPSYENIVQDAAEQKIKVFCIDSPPAHYYLYKMNLEQQYRHTAPLYTGQFHRAVPKERKDLLKAVEEGFAKISPKEHEAIEKRWRGSPIARPYLTYLFYLMGALVMLGSILLLWNHTLRQKVTRKTVQLQEAIDALGKSEEKYRELVKNAPAGIYEVDYETSRFISVNDVICEYTGYTKDELLTINLFNLLTQESQKLMIVRLEKLMAGEKLEPTVEYCIRTKDGNELWALFNALYIYEAGKLKGSTGVVYDITERKQAEEELRRMNAFLDSVVENIPNMIFLKDAGNLRFVRFNRAGEDLLGYSRNDLLGKSDYDFFPKVQADHFTKKDREVLLGKEIVDIPEELLQTRNKGERTMHTKKVPLLDASGEPEYLLGISEDITEQKRAEKQLQHTLDSLRKAFGAIVQVMVSAVESRDPYTSGHQIRSADLARAIATEMELPPDIIEGLRMAGSIHDIGKLSIPAEILSKPTKLTNLEFSLIKEHANKGFEMLKDVESPWPLAEIVHQHHERMDGSGYPRHLKGEEILMEARILAVADVVEAMASHRPYRPGLGIDAALNEIEKNRGIFYDEAVVDACLRLFREKGFKLENT